MADSTSRFGFVAFAETWNGRLAMLGFVIGLGTELLTGQGILSQIGLGCLPARPERAAQDLTLSAPNGALFRRKQSSWAPPSAARRSPRRCNQATAPGPKTGIGQTAFAPESRTCLGPSLRQEPP